jgi:hypothetical protein
MGEWFVRVAEGNSADAAVSSFTEREFAESFSAGQALRLKVAIKRG